MAARAIWKGRLRIGKTALAVKLVSAAVDKRVHFRLLHEKDECPLRQEMVNPETGEVVPREQVRRGYRAPDGTFVILSPTELAALDPPESRDIAVKHFVPLGALGPACAPKTARG